MLLQETTEDCFGRGTQTCDDLTKRVLRLEEASNETPMPLSYDPLPGTSYNYARADHSHLLPEEIEKALHDHNGNIIHEYYAPIDSPNFTGEPMVPTPELGDDSNRIATTEYVNNKVDSIDAMLYMGIVNDTSDLPSEHVLGWMFRVGTAGTYAGKECEVGDMIICNTTGTVFDPTHWDVILANIDGAVVGPTTSVDENIVIYDGASGKVVKDSGVNINDIYLKDDVDEIVRGVDETITNNALVTSAALNDLNSRIIQYGELLEEYSTESETNLNNATEEINNRIDEINTTIDENELTVSSALNDLNSRIISNNESITELDTKLTSTSNTVNETIAEHLELIDKYLGQLDSRYFSALDRESFYKNTKKKLLLEYVSTYLGTNHTNHTYFWSLNFDTESSIGSEGTKDSVLSGDVYLWDAVKNDYYTYDITDMTVNSSSNVEIDSYLSNINRGGYFDISEDQTRLSVLTYNDYHNDIWGKNIYGFEKLSDGRYKLIYATGVSIWGNNSYFQLNLVSWDSNNLYTFKSRVRYCGISSFAHSIPFSISTTTYHEYDHIKSYKRIDTSTSFSEVWEALFGVSLALFNTAENSVAYDYSGPNYYTYEIETINGKKYRLEELGIDSTDKMFQYRLTNLTT